MNGAEQRVFAVDVTVTDQGNQRIFQAKRTLLFGDGDLLMEMLQRVAPDVVARAVADQEEFGGGNAATCLLGEQDLGVDGGQSHGQFLAYGILALDGKRIGDARHSRGNIGRVDSA